MKPKDILMYIVDNSVILWSNYEMIFKSSFKKAVLNGKISRPTDFTKSLEKLIKKHKLNSGLFNNNLIVLVEPNYTEANIETLKNCLDKLSFNKVKIINITNICRLKKNTIWLLTNESYMYIIYLDYKSKAQNIFVDYRLFNNNLLTLIKHLSTIFKKKRIILLGNNSKIEELASTIEQITNNKTYYIDDSLKYIFKNIANTL